MNYQMLFRTIAVCAVLGVAGWGVRQGCRAVVAVTEYDVQIDPAFSQELAQHIRSFVREQTDGRLLFMPHLAKVLQEQFPAIEQIEITRKVCGKVEVMLKAVNPRVVVNNEQAFAGGKLLPTYQFSKEWLAGRAQASVQDSWCKDALNPVLAHCLANLDVDLLHAYNVKIDDLFAAFLHDKQHDNFSVRFNAAALPRLELVEQCQAIKNELLATGDLLKKPKKKWIADVRFDNQIVLSSA